MADAMAIAESFVLFLAVYFSVGAVIAIVFLTFGVSRIDDAAKGASPFFRPMIFPGCAVLWPFILLRLASLKKINQPSEGME